MRKGKLRLAISIGSVSFRDWVPRPELGNQIKSPTPRDKSPG